MNKRFTLFTALAVTLTTLPFTAPAALQSGSVQALDSGDVGAERHALEEALSMVRNGDEAGARPRLEQAIEGPAFQDLTEAEQHEALFMAGAVTFDLGDYESAHGYFVRSSSSPRSTGNDWVFRQRSAYAVDDTDDCAQSMVTIANTWPATLGTISDRAILKTADRLQDQSKTEAYTQLLEALFRAHWTQEGGLEPSELWQDLALSHLERQDLAGAQAVAARITEPYTLVRMRADNRYAELVKAMPARFDVRKALLDRIEQLRQVAQAHPRSLKWLVLLTEALMDLGRYDEVLKITDDAIARSKPSDGQRLFYDDDGKELNLIMEHRAQALEGLKRWDDAVAQRVAAARRPEKGDVNVTQTIHLGDLYFHLDRPDDALAAVADVGHLSPYGRMQLEEIRFVSALEKNDAAAADQSLQYLRAHSGDAPGAFFSALLYANRLDEASQFFLSLLADPKWRIWELGITQQFIEWPMPPREAEEVARFHTLCARPEIQEAIAKVGKVERYEIYRDRE